MRIGYFILLFLFAMASWSQDSLFLKDGSMILGFVKEVNFHDIIYESRNSVAKEEDVASRDVAMIIYGDGRHRVINRKVKCRVNFMLNLEVNKAFSNWPYSHSSPGMVFSGNYTQYTGTGGNLMPGLNTGANLLMGRRKNTNLLLTAQYTLSRSTFIRDVYESNIDFSGHRPPSFYHAHDTVRSQYHYLSVLVGMHFKVMRVITIEFGWGVKAPLSASNWSTGYSETISASQHAYESHSDKRTHEVVVQSSSTGFGSLGYDFKLEGYRVGFFVSWQGTLTQNLNNNNWFLAGLRFYPFRKHEAFVENQ